MPIQLRLGGARHDAEHSLEVKSPYDGRVLDTVYLASPDQLRSACEHAAEAHRAGPPPAWRRAEILDEAARRMADDIDRFAIPLCDEAAKPISIARGEVRRAVDTLRFSAAAARTFTGELLPLDASSAGEGKLGFVKRVPRGPVLGITPFNFPLNLVVHKVAPAIAAGCPIIIKPSLDTPLCAYLLAELLIDECGLPGELLQVLSCADEDAHELVQHEAIELITFTGSPRVGWQIKADVPRKQVSLELGNSTPLILEPDGDWRRAVKQTRGAGFAFAGQSCISVQRVFAHADIHEQVVQALLDEVGEIVLGDPRDEDTELAAMIRPRDVQRVQDWVDEAREQGAEVLAGGKTQGPCFQPTVLTGTTPQMKVYRQEVFAPVVIVESYDDLEEALRRANETEYGLQAGLFTADLGKAMRAADVLRFGGITINEIPTWRADHMPYGGIGQSGNTKEGPRYAMREMTEERLVVWKAP